MSILPIGYGIRFVGIERYMRYIEMRTIRMTGIDSRGQAIVELAIVLFLLTLLVMGIFEFGMAMFNKNTLTQAARSGARTAVVTPNLTPINSSLACGISDMAAVSACKSLPTQVMRDAVKIELTINAPDGSPHTTAMSGDTVTVTITWPNYQWLFLPQLTNPTFYPSSLTGNTAMRYE